MAERIRDLGALAMVAVALVGVAYLAAVLRVEAAQGALYAVLSAGVGYFLRGRVQAP